LIHSTASRRCPKCSAQTSVFDSTSGEYVCDSCGFVLEDRAQETGVGWRAFSPEERDALSHTGSPESLSRHDMGLSTVIGNEYKDAGGARLSSAARNAAQRMRTWDNRSVYRKPKDKNLMIALSELSRLAEKLNVGPNVVERAAYVYRKALDMNLVRGRTIMGMVSASLYEACRSTSTPRNLKDVAAVSGLKKTDLARCYRLLLRELNLAMPVVDPSRCVTRIASKAGISERNQRKALEILAAVRDSRGMSGKDPMGLAASALYLANTLIEEEAHVTQRDVAEAAGVTEVTIRNRSKGMLQIMGEYGLSGLTHQDRQHYRGRLALTVAPIAR
jgi:transcription initiation factor TFIIB